MIDSEHITLVNFSTWQSELKELPCGALHIIQHCLCIKKVSPIMKFSNDWLRMDHPWILQKEKVISCSCTRKGKVLNIMLNLEFNLITLFQWIAILWTSRVKPINCDYLQLFFPAERVRLIASTINWLLSRQRFYALVHACIHVRG